MNWWRKRLGCRLIWRRSHCCVWQRGRGLRWRIWIVINVVYLRLSSCFSDKLDNIYFETRVSFAWQNCTLTHLGCEAQVPWRFQNTYYQVYPLNTFFYDNWD